MDLRHRYHDSPQKHLEPLRCTGELLPPNGPLHVETAVTIVASVVKVSVVHALYMGTLRSTLMVRDKKMGLIAFFAVSNFCFACHVLIV